MAGAPKRQKRVYFVGAGLCAAYHVPNTHQLLGQVHRLSRTHYRWRNLEGPLNESYQHLYPIESSGSPGFLPNVVDYFSLLQSHIVVAQPAGQPALPGDPFKDAAPLLRDLKFAIADLILQQVKAAQVEIPNVALDAMFTPGNVIITSYWDVLLERYAWENDHPYCYELVPDSDRWTTILKLHGSIDWCLAGWRKRTDAEDFAPLSERMVGRANFLRPRRKDAVVRIRILEEWAKAWQFLKSRATEPLMVTMAPGKAPDLEELRSIWNDAYRAISAAKTLEFIGYSLPAEDLEIRALVLAGVGRGSVRSQPKITVQNPAPDVHDRFRALISRGIGSDYMPFIATNVGSSR